MGGRAGSADQSGRYDRLVYLPCTAENNFQPRIPDRPVDLIYLCYPNNPTGAVLTRAALKTWVDYARERNAVILYDAAYEAYIRDPEVPHSIYEDRGRAGDRDRIPLLLQDRRVHGHALRLHRRPKELQGRSASGEAVSLNACGSAAIHQVQRRGVRDPARGGLDLYARGTAAGEGARGTTT